jgi:hypothetical protein
MKDEVKANCLSFILHPSAFILSHACHRLWRDLRMLASSSQEQTVAPET